MQTREQLHGEAHVANWGLQPTASTDILTMPASLPAQSGFWVNTAPAYRWPQPHRPEWQRSNQTRLSESGSLINDCVTILHASGLYAPLDDKDTTHLPPTSLTTTASPLYTISPHDSWTPFSASCTLRSNTTPPPDPIPPTLPFLWTM